MRKHSVSQCQATNNFLPARLLPTRHFARLSALAAAMLLAGAALAQGALVNLDIPAQPLDKALNALALQSNARVVFATELTDGKTAPALKGALSPRDALDRLLAGSGLRARQEGQTLTVERVPVAAPAPLSDKSLATVTVTESATVPGELPKPYAGGQVARGGQLGILGNRDMMETPFAQSNYTAELMQNQQVRHIADVLNNDPTAHVNGSTSTGADDFSIRGFYVGNTDLLFNGLPGVAPTFFNSMMAESVERIEVLKGPNALLNGAAQNGSIGGAINVIPKRAGNDPLTQFTATYGAKSQLGGHIDISRRYGEQKEFGVRFNGVYRDGDTAIADQSRESRLLALGLDYRGDRLRLNADLGYQKQHFQGIRDFTTVAPGVRIPAPPNVRENYDGRFDFSNPEVYYGTIRGEFDLNERWTAFATSGGNERDTRYNLTNRTIVNAQGDLSGGSSSLTADKAYSRALEAGIQGRFATGSVQHQLVVAHSKSDRELRRLNASFAFPASNIYNPFFGTGPNSALQPDPDNARKSQNLSLSSTAIVDTLSAFDDRLLLTIGARHQEIDATRFNVTTGAQTTSYKEDRLSPMVGVVVKPKEGVSLYANYIEGLQQGPTAPLTAVNAGEIFAPFVTEQYELGAKFDFGRFATTLAVYQIAQPSGILDPISRVFGVDGEQRHRGIDVNVFGEVTRGLRMLGGAAYINSKLTKTQGGVNEGNNGVAVPKWRFVLGTEWDVPFVPALTLTGRVTHNGSMFLDAANTQKLSNWNRVDIGLRYQVNKLVTVRANLDNAFSKAYWDANAFGQLSLGDPRTFSLSATVDF